jgi:RHS repeat-associated protein
MGTDRYGYDAANRRVWKREQNPYIREFTYFYGVDGQLLGTYGGGYGGLEFGTGSTNVWFGGKLIWAEGKSAVTDRLGSVVNFGKKYYPYGEEPATTQQNHTKFATYYRDETTALDYAVNRYYARTIGRFLTPDPYQARVERGPGHGIGMHHARRSVSETTLPAFKTGT